jgi:uncharacterized protein YkwD
MASTNLEQYLLELIDEARLDPVQNIARFVSSFQPLKATQANIQNAIDYFGVSGSALQAQFAALVPAQPLAFSTTLADAARSHNAAMITADSQSHQVAGEADLGTRISAQGYNYTRAGENVYAYSEDALYSHAGLMIDWGTGPNGVQSPPGHRLNIMDGSFREVGIGVTAEGNPATNVGPLLVTQDFGTRGSAGAMLLGVAYNDTDRNGFYTPGEGLGSLSVTVAGAGTTSSASGGYSLTTAATGTQKAVLTGAGLSGPVTFEAVFSNGLNAKLDVVDGTVLRTSLSGKVSGPVQTIQGLGANGVTLWTDDRSHTVIGTSAADTITTGAGNDTVRGGLGVNTLNGGLGSDTAVFDFAFSAATITTNGPSVTVEAAGSRTTLSNFEHFAFTDRTVDTLGAPPAAPDADGVPNQIHRFYDTATGHHFYTLDSHERDAVLATAPSYRYEGTPWLTPDRSAGTVDVFRFYDTKTGDHFFTTSTFERDQIVGTMPSYKLEGVAFQAYANPGQPGTVQLDRFYNKLSGEHHFSANADESASIHAGAAGAGWVYEGPGFVVQAPSDLFLA